MHEYNARYYPLSILRAWTMGGKDTSKEFQESKFFTWTGLTKIALVSLQSRNQVGREIRGVYFLLQKVFEGGFIHVMVYA